MDLDAEINLVAGGLAQPPHILDCLRHLGRVRLEIGLGLALVEEGIEVTDGVEALGLTRLQLPYELVDRGTEDMGVEPRLVSDRAAEQLIDGHTQALALDVPERDVDRGDGAGNGGAREVMRALHHVPVVLDVARGLADEVLAEFSDGGGARLDMPPGTGFADAGNADIRLDAHEQEAIRQDGPDRGDPHTSISTYKASRATRHDSKIEHKFG